MCRKLPLLAKPRGFLGPRIRQHRLAGDGTLTDASQGGNPVRQIDIDAAAEADQAETLAGPHAAPRDQVAFDAPRHQSRDLYHTDVKTIPCAQMDRLPLVMLAGLVERRIDELSRPIGKRNDLAADRRAIHMHIEHVHEDADAGQRPLIHAQFRWRDRRLDHLNDTVGRRDHQAVPARRDPLRVAEEIAAPQRQDDAQPAQRLPDKEQDGGDDGEDADESPTLFVDRRNRESRQERHLLCIARADQQAPRPLICHISGNRSRRFRVPSRWPIQSSGKPRLQGSLIIPPLAARPVCRWIESRAYLPCRCRIP